MRRYAALYDMFRRRCCCCFRFAFIPRASSSLHCPPLIAAPYPPPDYCRYATPQQLQPAMPCSDDALFDMFVAAADTSRYAGAQCIAAAPDVTPPRYAAAAMPRCASAPIFSARYGCGRRLLLIMVSRLPSGLPRPPRPIADFTPPSSSLPPCLRRRCRAYDDAAAFARSAGAKQFDIAASMRGAARRYARVFDAARRHAMPRKPTALRA